MNNIYLVGFMGTGKTSSARLLALKLKRKFVDMDELIESREKTSIGEIFSDKGEAYFRGLEKGLVNELSGQENLIVACGGGVFVDEDNIKKLKSSGKVIALTSSPEMILKRTSGNDKRPLLNVSDQLARIEELLAKRMKFYLKADIIIDADKLTVGETADEILKMLGRDE